MDSKGFRLTAGFLMSLSLLNICCCQQNSIFNQSPYQRRQQTLLRQQQQQQQLQQQPVFPGTPFSPVSSLNTLNQISSLSPIVPQSAYRSYNQLNANNFVPITAYQNELNYDGSFSYGYSSADGTTAQAQGYVKNLGLGEAVEAQVVQGSYSYTSPEGTPITVRYIADENGFRAEGAHIPTPPPIPDAIAKSLQYINVQQQQQQQQPFQQSSLNVNPNLDPYQTPFRQFNTPQSLRLGQQQLTPLQLQQQRFYQQQQTGQYQPDNQFTEQQQRPFGVGNISSGQQLGGNFQQQQQQQQNLQNQKNLTAQRQQNILGQQQNVQQQQEQTTLLQQQQQQQQQQQPNAQQLTTQQLHGRSSQLVNPYGYNQYRRFKKATKV